MNDYKSVYENEAELKLILWHFKDELGSIFIGNYFRNVCSLGLQILRLPASHLMSKPCGCRLTGFPDDFTLLKPFGTLFECIEGGKKDNMMWSSFYHYQKFYLHPKYSNFSITDLLARYLLACLQSSQAIITLDTVFLFL